MRILQLNSARKYIGEAAHTLNLTEALRRRGHNVWLGLRKNFETYNRATTRGLEPISFNMPHRWWPPQDMPDIRQIARLAREHDIQIIHAHRGKDHWQATLAKKIYRLRAPVIRTRHVVTPLSSNVANRWLARQTAALIVVSRAVEEDARRTEMYSKNLRFIPGGIDLDAFAPASPEQKAAARVRLSLKPDALVAICVARFAIVKAHSLLLTAWKQVSEKLPAARLILVGAGQLMADNQALATSLGVSESVSFLGRRYDVDELLNAADVGVLASIGSEGFSRAVLEYLAKALPVVATRVGAIPDLIEDGTHGLLVAPKDVTGLSVALTRALSASQSERQVWGRAARDKAASGYGYDIWATAHENLYQSIIGNFRF
ncbi:MAG: glycosyltransferase family 4 protein [Planctomycetota bacterium]